jgi:uncharacterized membrane protein YkoI
MKLHIVSTGLLLLVMTLTACQGPGGSGPTKYNPPNTEFAAQLGIAPPPPVTADQAKAIAAEAAGGTAISVGQETEGGVLFYEVKVETSSGRKEVEVRASDGGVVEIEPDDND